MVINTFFYLNGIKYIVKYIDKKIIYYKEVNNSIIEISKEEQESINKILSKEDKFVYNSEFLNDLISENKDINNNQIIKELLEWLEKLIPIDCRENLYRNIPTLEVDLHLDYYVNGDKEEISKGFTGAAGYNTYYNKINIPTNKLGELKSVSEYSKNPSNFYWINYWETFLHELTHMSSTRFDYDNNISYCGFDTCPENDVEDINNGLTEGFTEMIALAGVQTNTDLASGYYVEACIINQLILLIGNEVFFESYFGNKGINNIKQKLHELINDEDKSFELFRNIELNYHIEHLNEPQNVYSNIIHSLLDYLERKIDTLFGNNEFDQISNLLINFEAFLLTPEKITFRKENVDNYVGLEEVLERFNSLKANYLQEKVVIKNN